MFLLAHNPSFHTAINQCRLVRSNMGQRQFTSCVIASGFIICPQSVSEVPLKHKKGKRFNETIKSRSNHIHQVYYQASATPSRHNWVVSLRIIQVLGKKNKKNTRSDHLEWRVMEKKEPESKASLKKTHNSTGSTLGRKNNIWTPPLTIPLPASEPY